MNRTNRFTRAGLIGYWNAGPAPRCADRRGRRARHGGRRAWRPGCALDRPTLPNSAATAPTALPL